MNMDTQQAFEMAVKHLRKQGRRSEQYGAITCMYRIPENNLKCAIGALIPDELYQESFEGKGIVRVMETFAEINKLFENVNSKLLKDLQTVHDHYEVTDWENELQELSKVYGLTMPSKGELRMMTLELVRAA
jgi:hypothetical protein